MQLTVLGTIYLLTTFEQLPYFVASDFVKLLYHLQFVTKLLEIALEWEQRVKIFAEVWVKYISTVAF